MMVVASRSNSLAWALAVATSVVALPVRAAEYDLADGKLAVSGSVFSGTVVRAASRDPRLLANVNSQVLGITGMSASNGAGRVADDGQLNFDRGEAVSTVLKGYLTLDYRWRNYGASASGMAWYDYALEHQTHHWGNTTNGYDASKPLSDAGADPRSRFSGVVGAEANVFGHHQFDDIALDWTAGYQRIDWGSNYVVSGGLRDLNPLDAAAATRPGVLLGKETRIPIAALFARIGLPQGTSVDLFYQLRFQANAVNQCGTFYAGNDFVAPGCNSVLVGELPDPQLAATPFLTRTTGPTTSNSGQFGLGVKKVVDPWATEFGLYAAQYHSRSIYYNAVHGRGDPDGRNLHYFNEYPEDIRMFGLTFDTRLRSAELFGELVYRPNQPIQLNAVEFLQRGVFDPKSVSLPDIPQGQAVYGYQRLRTLEFRLGATAQVTPVLGAAETNVIGEFVYKGVPNLPDPASDVRFGRSSLFGSAGIGGVCPPPATPQSCSYDGYVSRNAFGYRLRVGLRYADVIDGVDLMPALFFGQDLHGWSHDGLINEGRYLAAASLRARIAKAWIAEIVWLPVGGGTYNAAKDRSIVQAAVGFQF